MLLGTQEYCSYITVLSNIHPNETLTTFIETHL